MIPKLFVLCGLPASGKSTYAKELAEKYNANIHASDSIREELSGNINNQNINDLVFKTLHRRVKDDLANGKSCICDATNINYKRRMAFLQELNKIPCEKIYILMATPYEECLKNNANRDRKVPEEVIERMYKNFHIPYWYEGWDDIKVIYNYYRGRYLFPIRVIDKYINFNQNNHHHSLTLGEHLKQSLLYIQNIQDLKNDTENNIVLRISAVLHDCQKPFVKDFHNAKGEPSVEAHYYNHQYVSAFDSLFYTMSVNPLDVAIRIMWHMQPYFWEKDNNEKTKNKYRNMWGKILYDDIMLLHEADKNAH